MRCDASTVAEAVHPKKGTTASEALEAQQVTAAQTKPLTAVAMAPPTAGVETAPLTVLEAAWVQVGVQEKFQAVVVVGLEERMMPPHQV